MISTIATNFLQPFHGPIVSWLLLRLAINYQPRQHKDEVLQNSEKRYSTCMSTFTASKILPTAHLNCKHQHLRLFHIKHPHSSFPCSWANSKATSGTSHLISNNSHSSDRSSITPHSASQLTSQSVSPPWEFPGSHGPQKPSAIYTPTMHTIFLWGIKLPSSQKRKKWWKHSSRAVTWLKGSAVLFYIPH